MEVADSVSSRTSLEHVLVFCSPLFIYYGSWLPEFCVGRLIRRVGQKEKPWLRKGREEGWSKRKTVVTEGEGVRVRYSLYMNHMKPHPLMITLIDFIKSKWFSYRCTLFLMVFFNEKIE